MSATYSKDLPLFNSLGLTPFRGLGLTETKVGQVDVDGVAIEVFVSCAPAQFWRFVVHREEESVELRTGSGSFSNYWPSVELLAQGMLSFTVLEEGHEASTLTGAPDGPRMRLGALT